MSARAETQSASRLIAVVLFVGLPVLLVALAVLNLVQVADDRFLVAEKALQVAAFDRRLNAPTPDGKPLDLSAVYVDGASRSLASANLQQYLVDAIGTAAGRIIETVAVDPEASDTAGADLIHLRATLDIDTPGLLQLLYALESGTPLLDIETLSVRRLPDNTEGAIDETLRIDIAVRANWRPRTT